MTWRSLIDSYWVTIAYPLTLGLSVYIGSTLARRLYLARGLAWKSLGVEGGIFGMFGLLLSFTLVAHCLVMAVFTLAGIGT